MKKLEAVIKPYLLEDIQTALHQAGIVGMTVSEIQHFNDLDRGVTTTDRYRSIPLEVGFDCCLKLELVLVPSRVDTAIRVIENASLGQCSIVLQAIDDVVRIRTNEHGEAAIVDGDE